MKLGLEAHETLAVGNCYEVITFESICVVKYCDSVALFVTGSVVSWLVAHETFLILETLPAWKFTGENLYFPCRILVSQTQAIGWIVGDNNFWKNNFLLITESKP